MFTKPLRSMAAVTFVAGLALTLSHTAQAVTPVGGGPDNPAHNTGAWTTIQPGEYQWYAFKFHADKSSDTDNDERHHDTRSDSANQVDIRMYTQPSEGATLLLVDAQEARAWQQDGKLEHFGAATPVFVTGDQEVGASTSDTDAAKDDSAKDADDRDNKVDDTDSDDMAGYALWSSVMDNSGNYFVVIHRDIHETGPATYRFTVNGNGASQP